MNELKTIRKNIGITQEEAAKMVGVSRRTYQTYEEGELINGTYNKILSSLKNIQESKCENVVLSIGFIKKKCREIFINYPKVKCAYLYGSYSRGEATEESDVDILIVQKDMGMDFFGLGTDLMEAIGKRVDLQTHTQVYDDEFFIGRFLIDAIKIYKSDNPYNK